MPVLSLVPIDSSGAPADAGLELDDLARDVCESTAGLYRRVGFVPPWVCYLAVFDEGVAGTCGFTAPPSAGRVEIAYYAFPRSEGRGIATSMARELLALPRAADPGVTVTARTLRERNATVRILEKLGFTLEGTVLDPEEGEVWEWVLARGGA